MRCTERDRETLIVNMCSELDITLQYVYEAISHNKVNILTIPWLH